MTLAAARGAFPDRRLVLVFQPHRYSRTRDCFQDFVKVLAQADLVLLSDVYAAGEMPIAGADGQSLARAMRAIRAAGQAEPIFVADIQHMAQAVARHCRSGDVVLCMGAGSIGSVPIQILALAAQEIAL